MHFSKVTAAAMLAASVGLAQAGPVDLGTGVGTYNFTANHDLGFFVTLDPGTYQFNSTVTSQGFDLITVWYSSSQDHNPSGKSSYGLLNEITPTDWTGSLGPLTLTQTSEVFVDVNTHLGKLTDGAFNGVLTVSAVPEPAAPVLLLAGASLLGLMGLRRRS